VIHMRQKVIPFPEHLSLLRSFVLLYLIKSKNSYVIDLPVSIGDLMLASAVLLARLCCFMLSSMIDILHLTWLIVVNYLNVKTCASPRCIYSADLFHFTL
jgi:hypothetical protein